jgi:hypothetical protein
MARAQIGNDPGLTAVDKTNETLLGSVVSVTANNFVVSAAEFRNFKVGQTIDLLVEATGSATGGAAGRTVVGLNSATNTVTYSGDDIATLDDSFAAYRAGAWEPATPVSAGGVTKDLYTNFNGGTSLGSGFDSNVFGSIDAMRARLKVIASTTYTDAELDKMTMNDMVYAIRLNDAPGSIK